MTETQTAIRTETIDRLRMSFERHRKALHQQGLTDGRSWASSVATAPELIRLSRQLSSPEGYDFADWWRTIDPPDVGSVDFWKDVSGADDAIYTDEEYVRGFVEAAAEVWDQAHAQF